METHEILKAKATIIQLISSYAVKGTKKQVEQIMEVYSAFRYLEEEAFKNDEEKKYLLKLVLAADKRMDEYLEEVNELKRNIDGESS